jgi:hypothetical protein
MTTGRKAQDRTGGNLGRVQDEGVKRRKKGSDAKGPSFAQVFFFHSIINRLISRLIVADGHALLVVGGGLVVGVNDGVGGHAVGVVGLGPGVDGVDVIQHGEKNGEHYACPAQIELAATLCAEVEATMFAGLVHAGH